MTDIGNSVGTVIVNIPVFKGECIKLISELLSNKGISSIRLNNSIYHSKMWIDGVLFVADFDVVNVDEKFVVINSKSDTNPLKWEKLPIEQLVLLVLAVEKEAYIIEVFKK